MTRDCKRNGATTLAEDPMGMGTGDPASGRCDRLGAIGATAVRGQLQSVSTGHSSRTSLSCARPGKGFLGGNAFPLNWTSGRSGPVTPFCGDSAPQRPEQQPPSRAADNTRTRRSGAAQRSSCVDKSRRKSLPRRTSEILARSSLARRGRRQRPVLCRPSPGLRAGSPMAPHRAGNSG